MADRNNDILIRLQLRTQGDFKSAEASARAMERELNRVEAAQRSMASAEASAYREAAAMSQKRRDAAADLGKGVAAAGAIVAAGVVTAVKAFADFDEAMSSVKASTGAPVAELDKLREAAIKAGSTTKYSATEAAGAINELAKAGVSTSDILNGGLAGALNLAAAGQIDVADAAETAASAMTQFKLSGEAVPHIADLLAAGANKAQGSVSDLGDALAQSGLVASQMGLSIDETVGTLSAFASAGLMGSDAGTSFKTMLLALANPSTKAAETMGELGIAAYDAQGNFVGIAGVAEQLKTKLSGLTQEQRDSALATIFGSDAIRAAAVLYSDGAQGINEWTAAVDDQGIAAETAATQMDNLKGDIEQLKGSLETLLITLGGGAIGDWARNGTQEVDKLIDGFNQLPAPVQDAIGTLGAVTAGAGLLTGAALILIPKLLETKETLNAVGITAASTQAALVRFGSVAAMTAGLVAAAWAGAKIADEISKVSTTADQTQQALLSIADGSKVAASSFDLFDVRFMGNTVGEVKDADQALKTFADTANTAAGGGFRQFAETVGSLGGNKRRYSEWITEIDSSLSNMVKSGNAEQAAAAFKKFRDAAVAQGVSGKDFDAQFGQYNAALDASKSAAASAATQLKVLSDSQAEVSGTARELTEEEAKLRDELAQSAADFVNILGAYTDTLDAKADADRKAAEATAASTKDSKDSWQDYVHDVHVSVDQYLAELDRQVKAQQDWETNLLSLASRVSAGTIQELAKLGPEGAPLIAELVNASDEQLAHMEDLYGARASNAVNAIADELTNAGPVLAALAAKAGQETADEYARKLADGTVTVRDIAQQYGIVLDQNIPDAKNTDITVSGTSQAIGEVKNLQSTINLLNGKTITIKALLDGVTPNIVGGRSAAQGQGGSGGQTAYATGGFVSGPGTGTSDSIPALLSNGEFVATAASTAKHRTLLELINRDDPSVPRFAKGGAVGINVNVPSNRTLNSDLADALRGPAKALQSAAHAAAEAADSSETAGQGTAASGGQGSGWQWQIATLRKAFPGLALNSGARPGAKTVSGNTSYHARGRAVDVPPRMDVFNWLLANYGNSPEIIFSPANGRQIKNGRPHMYSGAVRSMHFNHVHWAYRDGGLVGGPGGPRDDMVPAMLSNGEFVVNARSASRYRQLLEMLNAGHFADGGLVSRGTRTSAPAAPPVGTSVSPGSRSGIMLPGDGFHNGADLGKYLTQAMKPVKVVIDDSDLRRANYDVAQWTSALAGANDALREATKAADFWGDEVKLAQDAIDDAQSRQTRSVSDLESAQKRLTSATKSLNKVKGDKNADADDLATANENYAEALKDVNDVLAEQKDAQATLTTQTARLTQAKEESAKASGDLAEKTANQASVEETLTSANQKAADAQTALNAAKAEALAYAQKIAATAISGAELTGLFTEEDVTRALKFAEAAYTASKAQAVATTDATEYQSAIDQVAASGAKLAAAQAASGASYATQKATLAATRAEVDALARSYGFTAEQAAALAESAVPLANTGDTLVDSLTRQLTAVTDFSKSVETLRALGLSQGLIDQILEAGPEKGLALAQELISGGSDMVKKLNALQAQLETASNSLGQSAANAAYSAPTLGAAPKVDRGMRILKASGGLVSGPGTGTSDSIPAYLSNGEYVVKAAAVARYGRAMFDDLNSLRLARGGFVADRTRAVTGPAGGGSGAPQVVSTGPNFYAPIFDNIQVRETVDFDLAWQRAPLGLTGALGVGGGR